MGRRERQPKYVNDSWRDIKRFLLHSPIYLLLPVPLVFFFSSPPSHFSSLYGILFMLLSIIAPLPLCSFSNLCLHLVVAVLDQPNWPWRKPSKNYMSGPLTLPITPSSVMCWNIPARQTITARGLSQVMSITVKTKISVLSSTLECKPHLCYKYEAIYALSTKIHAASTKQ